MKKAPLELGLGWIQHWRQAAVVLLALPALAIAQESTFTVTSTSADSSVTGSLGWAIGEANVSGGPTVIRFSEGIGTINLTSQLFINLSVFNTGGLTIEGEGVTLDMGQQDRAFFVLGGKVNIKGLTIQDGLAQGGAGVDGGGGGAGLGGAVFVASGSTIPGVGPTLASDVTLENVKFRGNSAQGGAGGGKLSEYQSGGGGGMGGNGGQASVDGSVPGGGGGGGFGSGANGGNGGGSGQNGSAGEFVNGLPGGNSDDGGSGGAWGGGGGGGAMWDGGLQSYGNGGGGGVNGGGAFSYEPGDGGFGGGGGGAAQNVKAAGAGGFGGGGGSNGKYFQDVLHGTIGANGGNGGFGGGGGVGWVSATDPLSGPGLGGFAGGNGGNVTALLGTAYGGGGAGLGGAVFVMAGSRLTINDSSFLDNAAAGGTGEGGGAQAGSGFGSDVFYGGEVKWTVNDSRTLADGALGSGASVGGSNAYWQDPNAAGSLEIAGSGHLFLEGSQAVGNKLTINATVSAVSASDVTVGRWLAIGDSTGSQNPASGSLVLNGASLTMLAGSSGIQLGVQAGDEGRLTLRGTGSVTGVEQISAGQGLGTLEFAADAGQIIVFGSALAGNLTVLQNGPGAAVLTGDTSSFHGNVGVKDGVLLIEIPTFSAAGVTIQSGTLAATDISFSSLSMSSGVISASNCAIGTGASGTASLSGGFLDVGSSLTIGNNTAGILVVSGSGAVSVASGTGTLMLATGTDGQGTLQIGHGDVFTGTIATAEIRGSGGLATVDFRQTNAISIDSSLNGVLNVVQSGAGMTSLTNTNNYLGTTTINSGTLAVRDRGSIASTSVVDVADGTLAVGSAGAVSTSIVVVGSNSGTGRLNLSGGLLTDDFATVGGAGSLGVADVSSGTWATNALFVGNSGTGRVLVSGSGTTILAEAHTYTGTTLISAGTLMLTGEGSISHSAQIEVASGATWDASAVTSSTLILGSNQTLSGGGSVIADTLAISGSLAPSALTQEATELEVDGDLELFGTTKLTIYSGFADSITVSGEVRNGGTLEVLLDGDVVFGTYNLFSAEGGFSDEFFGGVTVWGIALTESNGVWLGSDGTHSFAYSATGTDAGQLIVSAIPEPGSVILLGAGLFGALVCSGRRRLRKF